MPSPTEAAERLKEFRDQLLAMQIPIDEVKVYIVAWIQAEAMRAEPLEPPTKPRPRLER